MKLYWKIIIGVIAAIIIGGVAAYFFIIPPPTGLTVKEFEHKMINELNNKLADSENEIRSAVRRLHNANRIDIKVTGIKCTAIDGGNYVGHKGKKIQSIKARITAKWENSTHKGITVFRYESTRSPEGNLTTPTCDLHATYADRKKNRI
jgi:hypothetical protein